jgi:amino acid permease
MLLLKTQIGLGVLALPNVMMTLGIVPALIVIILLGLLTSWGDYGAQTCR